LYVFALFAIIAAQLIPIETASAAQIVDRSLTLEAGATDGGSKVGGSVDHRFDFQLPGGSDVGSIKFEYCTLAANDIDNPACVTPTGLTTTSATLDVQTGVTGFTMVNTTNGAPYLTRTAATIGSNVVVSYTLATITNPTTITNPPTIPNQTFFVRIKTYASEDVSGSATDAGTVAASTNESIDIDGTMPESLVFCTGETVSTTGGVPDCSTATDGAITFNQLFSPTDTASVTSQMAASTNAGAGYAISVNGPTLTSGSNTVTAMGAVTTGVHGVSQFGLNLKANTVATTTVPVGTEVAPAANGTNYRGQALAGYGTVDEFKFVPGDNVAASTNGGAGGSDAQIFTASYIVNVPGSQPAGTYTTTLTYICTPTF